MAPAKGLEKYCLVTVGATVGFRKLTKEVLEPTFWAFLVSLGFTALHVQCGPDMPWASTLYTSKQDQLPSGFQVDVFDSKKNLQKEEMMLCKAQDGSRAQGLIIAHAGSLRWTFDCTFVANVELTYFRDRNYT